MDKAGSKVAVGLLVVGLIFTLVCECHCLSIVAGPSGFNAGFGTPKQGDYNHAFQLLHTVYRTIRKHCGKKMFFQHLHRHLDQKLIAAGAPDGVRTNADKMENLAGLGSTPMQARWESTEKLASVRAFRLVLSCSQTFSLHLNTGLGDAV